MHEVLVNRLGGLRLPRKSVVRLTDRPDMTLDVYRGSKATITTTLFLNENICCDPSLECCQPDGSKDGSQNIFNGKMWKIIPNLSLLLLIRSTRPWEVVGA